MNPLHRHDDSDLDWSAFAYLAGELPQAEAEAFEALLAADQAAREALARAVELSQVVAAAESQCGELVTPAGRVTSDWGSRLTWMAIGGLASLLLALLWTSFPGDSTTATHPHVDGIEQELAAAWSETREQLATAKAQGLYPTGPAIASDLDDDGFSEEGSLLEELAVAETPSWMTSAVFGIAGQPLNENPEPFVDERMEN